jgi:hypothetical protein
LFCFLEYSWTPWSEYDSCFPPCGEGFQTRMRKCLKSNTSAEVSTSNLNFSEDVSQLICEGNSTERRKCFYSPCNERDGKAIIKYSGSHKYDHGNVVINWFEG